MESGRIRHTATVVGTAGTVVRVAIKPGSDTAGCGGCALAAVCSPAKDDSAPVIVDADLPATVAPPAVGTTVTVEAAPGGTSIASVILLVVPLAVFLAVAVGGTLLEFSPALTGIASLAVAALSFPVIRSLTSRRGGMSVWRVIPDDK